jgi:putative membrane protein
MTPRSLVESIPMLAIARRLGLWLVGITVYSLAVNVVVHWWNVRPVERTGAESLVNTVILGLLLGFRHQAAYDRWWEARRLWGQLTNDSRNLAWKLAAFLPAAALAGTRVADLLAIFPEALKRHLRAQPLRLRELAGFENEQDDPAHVPSYLAGRLYAIVAEWKRAGIVDEAVLRILDPHLRALLDVCGGCERILNTPVSPSYKVLLRAGLALNVLVEPWYISSEIGFWGVPIFLLGCVFLLGLELIDTVVEEPFGRERDDLDLDRYCRTIEDSIRMSLASRAKSA